MSGAVIWWDSTWPFGDKIFNHESSILPWEHYSSDKIELKQKEYIYIYISYTASIDYCLVNLSDWYVLRYWTPEAKLYTALQNKAVLLSGSQRSCIRRRRQHVTQSTHPACLAQSRLESRGGETMFSSQASIQGLGPTRIAPNDCHFNNVLWLVECAQTW